MDPARLIAHLDRAQRLSNTGSWEWDIRTNDLEWSAQCYRMFGLDPHAIQPKLSAFLERVHPDDQAFVERRLQRAIEGTEDYALDYRIILPDGAVRTVHALATVECDPDGRAARMLGAIQDITEIRAAEQASRRSQDMLASMLKISPEAILITDSTGRILLFSVGAEEVFGYAADEVIGLGVEHLMPTRFRGNHRRHLQEFAVGPPASLRMHERSQIFGLRKNGEEFPAEASLAKLETENGYAFTTLVRDLSIAKAAEQRLMEARDAAERANLAKSTFLANMSHEIRTPLNGVLGVAGALARTSLSANQLEMVRLMETSGRALEGLLGDILDLAKLDAGRMPVRAEPFELDALARDTFALFQASAAEKGIDFHMTVAAEASGWFLGDDLKVKQILSNLLSNAVKFTAEGAVRLSIGDLGEEEGRRRIRFTVEDTGIGFPPEISSSLFERFEQADGSITRRFGGTGLGLAISKSLVMLMGGTISATSRPGQGAIFVFEAPLPRVANVATADHARPPSAPAHITRPMRVLLAEDHAINRLTVEMILHTLPVELTCVVDGQQAVAAAETQVFDLILMDMQMPVMDGLTAISLIRAREAGGGARVPICVLSANALPEHKTAANLAGADDFLTKPIDAGALISLVIEAASAGEPAAGEGRRNRA